MSAPYRFWENNYLVSLLTPSADSAGRTSSYYSLRNAVKATVVFYLHQGNAATVLLSVLQGQGSAGANSKAITAAPIVYDEDNVASSIFNTTTAATTYTTSATTKDKIVMFEIDPIECMDINNATPYDHIAVSTGASNAANITSAFMIMGPLRDAMVPALELIGV
jgi:hypothetical protein